MPSSTWQGRKGPLLEAAGERPKTPSSKLTERWEIAPSHSGIEHAQLAVVNIREEAERARAEQLVEDLLRLRKDEALFADILGRTGTRIPIIAVAANLTDPKDQDLKKALARVKRVIRKVHTGT